MNKHRNISKRIVAFFISFVFIFMTIAGGNVSVYAVSVSENTWDFERESLTEESTNLETADNEEFEGIYNQKSGDLNWSIDTNGHLSVWGKGNYGESYDKYPAWMDYAEYILTASVNVSDITRTDFMFMKCKNLKSIDFSQLDTSKVTNMMYMFDGCQTLESLDLRGFDTRNVTDMAYMFSYCYSLKTLNIKGTHFSTSKVKNMQSMFLSCKSLQNLDLSGFDVSEVTDIFYMFRNCESLTTLDLSGWNAQKATDMKYMFANCTKLESITLNGFKAGSVTNLHHMFLGAKSLREVIFDKQFDTSNVTSMYGMFEDCVSLETIDVTHFNTDKVTTFAAMFSGCRKLNNLNISNFNTRNAESMSSMFSECSSLERLDLSNFETTNLKYMTAMFYDCNNLVTLDVSSFNTANVTSLERVFWYCNSIQELDLSNFVFNCIEPGEPFYINIDNLQKFTSGKETQLFYFSGDIFSDENHWVDTEGNIYLCDTQIELKPNTTLYRLKDSYNIIYKHDGLLVGCQHTYNINEPLSLTGYVKKSNYTFEGWYLDENFTKEITEIPVGTYGDITIYPKMLPKTYSITYKNIEDVTNAEKFPAAYTYGDEILIDTPLKTCYLFDGWYLDQELTKAFSERSQAIGGDIVLYAKWKENHTLDKENGVVIKEATTTSDGELQYKCKFCSYTEIEKIPRIVISDGQNTPESPSAQENPITEETILSNPDDGDIKGSDFTKIQARSEKTTKSSIRMKWNRVEDADGYKIYGNKCGKKNKYKLLKNIKNGKKTSWTQKKCKKGTYYKYIVRAYKIVDGQEVTLAVSKTIHVATSGGSKGNAKAVNIKTDKKCKKTKSGYTLTLKKGKKYTIKASEKAGSKKISRHRNIQYDSTNKEVATVSKGVVKAKGKGTCYIYAYAQNGVFKKIKVVVK